MPDRSAIVSLSSNNPLLEKILLDQKFHDDIKFSNTEVKENGYLLLLIDLSRDLTKVSQEIIDRYQQCQEKDAKLAVAVLHGQKIDNEKNLYFQKFLNDLGKNNPLHRLIILKDLYQSDSDHPLTTLDTYINEAIIKNQITISQKGENLLYPLSLKDFVSAFVKIIFLSGTQGKTFWLLGDPLSDLELAYLLKKIISNYDLPDLEINATAPFDPQSKTLLSFSTKARAELNWNTSEEIQDLLKIVVQKYKEGPPPEKITANTSPNIFKKIVYWYRDLHRPQLQPRPIPKLKQILGKIIAIILGTYLFLGLFCALATILSLINLEKSVQSALNGDLKTSVSRLNNSKKFSRIGESLYLPLSTPINTLFPKENDSVYNLYAFSSYTQTAINNLQQTYSLSETFLDSLNQTNNQVNYNDLGLALHSNLSQVYENLNQIESLSQKNNLPIFVKNRLQNNAQFQNLKTLENQVVQFIKIVDLLPSVMSGSQAKNILVLLQNNHLLTPSGGNVDFYLLLTLDQGRLVSKNYYTSLDLQNLASGTSSANIKSKKSPSSAPINPQNLLSDPDFSVSALNLSSYLTKILKNKPDFVVAINNTLVENLLQEEKSPEYNSFVADFVTSSGPDLYKNQVDHYLDRLFKHELTLPVLGRALAKTVGDNQLLIWSADITTEKMIASQSYSGVITQHPCHSGLSVFCLSETSYLSETQSPSERRSPWADRQIIHNLELVSNQINHEYQLSYTPTTSPSSSTGSSAIYNVYLSSPSTLDQLLLDNLPYSVAQVTKQSRNGLDLYQIPVSLDPSQHHVLNLKISSTISTALPETYSYSLTEYRQPGTTDKGIGLKVSFPSTSKLTVISSPVTSTDSSSSFNLVLPTQTSTFGFTLEATRQ